MTSRPVTATVGAYTLHELLGRGGMGAVYRARHTRLGSDAAIKVLPPALADEPEARARFAAEARAAAALEHPNILPVWDYGEQGGAPYLVMPFVRGGTLKERLERGPLERTEALNYLVQMAAALDYAHERGLVHRDVKPANLLLDGRGRLYLADFGIAKALEGAEGLTRTGVGVGTPEYMAPEQARGRADARSDLYALAIILYQMLTGQVPYRGNSTLEVLMQHLEAPVPLLPLRAVNPALPPAIEGVIQRALAKNPNDRYRSGAAMVEAATEALAGGRPAAAMPTVAEAPDPARTVVAGTPPAIPPPGQTVPAPGWGPPVRATSPPPPVGAAAGGAARRASWQLPVVVAMLAGLLLGGGGIFALTRPATDATATANARSTETGTQAAAIATATASAPIAVAAPPTATAALSTHTVKSSTTPVAPTATAVPPTATRAPPTATPAAPTPAPLRGEVAATLRGHTDHVRAVAWSPDGVRVASAADDGTVRVWRAADGAPLATLRGHTDKVTDVAWAPDGTALASASDDLTVRVWRAADGAPLATLGGHADVVTGVAWAPDGRALASASYDGTLVEWRAADGARLATLRGHADRVTGVAWAPDGSGLASSSWDQTVRLWR